MPSHVFPKHQVLILNAIDNAKSAMKKSTMICIMCLLCIDAQYTI